MDYNKLIANLKKPLFAEGSYIVDHYRREAATAITELLVENQALRNAANGFKERAEAAVKELEKVSTAVDDLSDFIDEEVHPWVPYDIYTALRENADAISVWEHEEKWNSRKEK